MATQFTTKTLPSGAGSGFNTESALIRRETRVDSARTWTTLYDGPCDFQLETGSTYRDPAGTVAEADATLTIDPAADGSLPAVLVGDTATVAGVAYTVKLANPMMFPPAHLELLLQRGDAKFKQPVK